MVLVHGAGSCGPLLFPWPVQRCGYTVLWMFCPCCMAAVGTYFLFWRHFGLSFFCEGLWTLRADLLLRRVHHSLYDCGLYVRCSRPLSPPLSLLLAGMLCIIWTTSALNYDLRFFCSSLCYDRVLDDKCLYTSLWASSTPVCLRFGPSCYRTLVCLLSCLDVDSMMLGCFVLGVSFCFMILMPLQFRYRQRIDGLPLYAR